MGIWRRIGDGEWVGTDASERFPVYTRGNAGEVYPEVFRPLSFSMSSASGEQAMRNAMMATGVIRSSDIAGIPLTTAIGSGVFGGYAYMNLSIQRMMATRLPGGSAADVDAAYLGVGDAPEHIARDGDLNRVATLAGVRWALKVLRTTAVPQLALDQERVDEHLAALPDPDTATDDELLAGAMEGVDGLIVELFERHLRISGAAGAMTTLLAQTCEKELGDETLALRLLSGLGDVDSAAPSEGLWILGRMVKHAPSLTEEFEQGVDGLADRIAKLAASGNGDALLFADTFDEFLARYGSRGPNEWDTAFDTWETKPELALVLIDRMRVSDPGNDPRLQQERLARERDVAEIEALTALAWSRRRRFRRILAAARFFSQRRERTKTTVVRAIHGSRRLAQELDRRLVVRSNGQRGDLWFLVREELEAYVADPASFADTIAERRRVHAELSARIPPFVFEGEIPPLDTWEMRGSTVEPAAVGDVLTGLSGCPGVATGPVRVVLDPSDPRGLEPGEVLVAPITDPSWTPLFVPAEAIIVDVGAVMSHAVIVSRELGKPCAVSVYQASRRLPDGAVVRVDGTNGTVTVLELPS